MARLHGGTRARRRGGAGAPGRGGSAFRGRRGVEAWCRIVMRVWLWQRCCFAVHRLDWLNSCERAECSLQQLRSTKLFTSVACTEAPELHLVC